MAMQPKRELLNRFICRNFMPKSTNLQIHVDLKE